MVSLAVDAIPLKLNKGYSTGLVPAKYRVLERVYNMPLERSMTYFFFAKVYCGITTSLRSHSGSAVVSAHPPSASTESGMRLV